MSGRGQAERAVDPRAVRVAVMDGTGRPTGTQPRTLEPGGTARAVDGRPVVAGANGVLIVDGAAVNLRLERFDAVHAAVIEGAGDDASRSAVLLMPVEPPFGRWDDVVRREVVVDGWRIEVGIESARHAALRDRARREDATAARHGPEELRAVIPGRILSVHVTRGDTVAMGQQLLVIEAMKMQNELRAPRDGVVARVNAAAGQTIEIGDLLVALE